MKRLLPLMFLYDLAFWLCYFFMLRLAFILYNVGDAEGAGLGEILSTWWHGSILDLSTTSYLLLFPFLLYAVYAFIRKNWILRIRNYYVLLILLIISAISVADLELYTEWGVKINSRAIRFLEHPTEVFRTTRTGFLILGSLLILLFTFPGWFIYRKIWKKQITVPGIAAKLAFCLLTPAFLFWLLRGGTGPIPVQVSDVYFSKNNFLNLAATNTTWQLVHSIIENKKVLDGNPYNSYPLNDATKNVQDIHFTSEDSTAIFLENRNPNIVMIIMEGVSADVVGSLGGFADATPFLNSMISQGIAFDSLFACGNLSDQGMSTIFSGFPAQPIVSITAQPDKFKGLPSLTKDLKANGYYTSFLFGGELTYGNMRAYMIWNEFDKITEAKDLADLPSGKLGVHDEYIFAEQIRQLKGVKEPFFSSIFTMSTHSPYDHPGKENKFQFKHEENDYVNSVHYFDKQLKIFIENCRKESWFDNTLFVLVSDHSHRTPKGLNRDHPDYRRIPLVFWGAPVKHEWNGIKISRISSQVDLASTLLHQLGVSAKKYTWSKDLFNPYTPEFAYYENTNGFGWIRPGRHVVWDPSADALIFDRTLSAADRALLLKEGRSYLQVLFEEYSNY